MSLTYRNPIQRAGDFADPFVLRHEGVYYLYCTNPDVRCWSSRDLVDWTLEGPTIEPEAFPGLVPFAPEVVYADGFFYMYTSPSGHGHFVLRSDSPTGPFRAISGNVGHAIDGNVFIDDDGRWYFYWAGDEGIWGCEMSSPTEFGIPVFTGISMNGWTEGPFVSKRDGVYFMTLTGNHYLSPGYRIDAASSDHPLRGYEPDPLNPVLVSTEGAAVGLGHSSSVTGPDLVSTYLVYHNLNPDASRDLDIDRQVWSGRSLQVLGPTTSAPVPSQPDVEWDGRTDTPLLPEAFTAELNLTAAETGAGYGLSLGDALTIRIDRDGTVTARDARDAALASSALPPGFVHAALHCWRLVYDHGHLRVFVDGRLQLTLRHDLPAGSRISLTDGVLVGHCAMTRAVAEVADRLATRPAPGRFWADADGSYELHVQRPGLYTVYVADAAGGQRSFALALDVGEHTLALGDGADGRLVTVALAPDGGEATFAAESSSGTGKRLLADARWDDFVLTATLSFTLGSRAAHADLILRAAQLSEGGEGDDTVLGANFFLGYSVQLHHDRVRLARHDYDERVLAERELAIDQTRPHVVGVRLHGSSFAVEVDGVEALRFEDALPHPAGHIGIRAIDSDLRVESLTVSKE